MTGELLNPSRRSDAGYSAAATSFLVFVPKFLVIFAALTLVVNGALPQLQMVATGGDILFKPRQLTIFALSFGTILLLKGRLRSSPLLPITLFLAGYLPLEALFLHFYQGLSFAAIRKFFGLLCFSGRGGHSFSCTDRAKVAAES